MADAGELFVKIRPNTTGFTSEASGSVAAAGRDLSKIFLAAFAVGGVALAIKGVVEAATKQQTAFAVLDQVLKNAGQSTEGFSASLKDKLEVQARATGVSAEDLAAAMDRLVPATHNAQKSLTDLNTAIGISETYHISLSTAALALAKAETGSFNSLQRYLGAIPRLTTNTDELKAKYTALTEAGGKLDASQKAQYESALKAAEAQDKVLTAQNSLALATQKFGGVPAAFAASYQGAFNRLHVSVEQLKVAVGTELVGGLAHAASGTADFLSKLLASNRVQDEARQTAHDLGTAFHEVGDVLGVIGPPLLGLVNDLGGFVRVAEIGAAVFIAYKVSLLGTASADEVAAASTTSLTAALVANTEALGLNTAALTGESAAVVELGAVSEATAAKAGLLTRGLGLLTKALGAYLIVNQAIKLLPGQHDLGLDFSNNTAKFVAGDHGSPYQKGSPLDAIYQAGRSGQKGPTLNLGALGTEKISQFGKSEGEAYAEGLKAGIKDGLVKGGTGFFGSDPAGFIKKAFATSGSREAAAKAGSDAIQALRTGVATDKTDLAQLGADMADAVTQGTDQIAQAVQSAKQNLNTIGASLATTIGTFIDKPLNDEATRLSDTSDRIAAQFDKLSASLQGQSAKLNREQAEASLATAKTTLRNLGTSVLLPGGHTLSQDPKQALAELERLQKSSQGSPALEQFIQQYQSAYLAVKTQELALRTGAIDARRQAATTGVQLSTDALKLQQDHAAHVKTQALRQISDLTDLLNKGAISEPTFNRDIGVILTKNHLTWVAAAKRDGVAFADTFVAQLTGLDKQIGALRAGPQQAGTGLIPSIVRPLDTANQVQKQIASIASQERAKQLDETKKTNDLLKKIEGATAAAGFTASLGKNPGTATKRTAALTGVGA